MDQKFRVASQYISEKVMDVTTSLDEHEITELAIAIMPLQVALHIFTNKLCCLLDERKEPEPPTEEEEIADRMAEFVSLFGGNGSRS